MEMIYNRRVYYIGIGACPLFSILSGESMANIQPIIVNSVDLVTIGRPIVIVSIGLLTIGAHFVVPAI